jgi:putative phage-type endonuclease
MTTEIITGPTPNTPEWAEERRRGIGASDAAAVCGMSPYATPLDVYLSKIGETQNQETQDMRRGTLLEPAVLQMYTDATGAIVAKPARAIVSELYPFMRANLDAVAQDSPVGIEAKTARTRAGWGEPGSAEIPVVYLFQVQHAMVVARLPIFHVAVLFGNFEFAIYEVPADAEFQELLVERERAFWAMVESRTPPEPVNAADMARRWPISRPIALPASPRDLEVASTLRSVRDYIGRLEAVKEALETQLKRSMGDAEALVVGNEPICTWRSAKGARRFDGKRFEAEHPELHAQYVTQSDPIRRFLFKETCPCLPRQTPPSLENLLNAQPMPSDS